MHIPKIMHIPICDLWERLACDTLSFVSKASVGHFQTVIVKMVR